jgi:riboflavin synthase alpha subunit
VTSLRSEHWPTVGNCNFFAIRTDRVGGGYTYKSLVTYQNEVGGHSFEGHATTVSDIADTEQMAKIIIAAYPIVRSVV